MIDWNYERYRTRDRLRAPTQPIPYYPHNINLPYVYPWEDASLAILSEKLYQIALQNGFIGSSSDFLERFSSNNGQIVRGTIATFPVPGSDVDFYFDEETEIFYYFKATDTPINVEAAGALGATIVGTNGSITYLYIPVRAMPLENIIWNCGDAAEFID